MTTDKELEIGNKLENIEIARESVNGAMADILRLCAEIRDIMNADPMEGLYKRDQDADAKEKLNTLKI